MTMDFIECFASEIEHTQMPDEALAIKLGSQFREREFAIDEPQSGLKGDDNFPPCNFSDVVEQLQGAGRHIRSLDDKIRRFQQHQDLQSDLRAQLSAAINRASLAESKALEADARATIAEERARKAEQWLACIRQTVRDEFSDLRK